MIQEVICLDNSLVFGVILGAVVSAFIFLVIKDSLISYFLSHAIFKREGALSEESLSKIKNIQLIEKYLDILTKTRNNLSYMLNFNKDLSESQKKGLWDNINETDNLIQQVKEEIFNCQEDLDEN